MECGLDKRGREREKFPTSRSLCLRRISLAAGASYVELLKGEREGGREEVGHRALFPLVHQPPRSSVWHTVATKKEKLGRL